MLIWLLFTALVIAVLSPDSPAGKMLRNLLIDLPTRLLAKLTPVRILFGVLVIAAIAGLLALAKSNGLMLVAQGVPELIGWFAAFDVATYVDVIGLVLLIAATVKLRAAFRASCAVAARSWRGLMRGANRLHFIGHRAKARRRRPRKTSPPPSDGDDRGWWAPAYAWA
jgi:hypothetical protein